MNPKSQQKSSQNSNEEISEKIFKDYTEKIDNKILQKQYNSAGNNAEINTATSQDYNNLVILLNWCFAKRNNFFIVDFNLSKLKNIYSAYNKLKCNILINERYYIFRNINMYQLKSLKFILSNYVKNFRTINKGNNVPLCMTVSKISIINCIKEINAQLNLLLKENQ